MSTKFFTNSEENTLINKFAEYEDVQFATAAIIFIGWNIQSKFKSETISKVKEIVDIILKLQDKYISQCISRILDDQ